MAAGVASWGLGCDKGEVAGGRGRSEQVMATGGVSSLPPPDAGPHATTFAPRRGRRLCGPDGDVQGRTLPRTPASHAEALGAERLDGLLRPKPGEWTWVNFWAGWCAPCLEEIPRLLAWRDRLASAGVPLHLVFVSLDDDERQLRGFLDGQPARGLRSTLWLPDGPRRVSWLASLRLESAPQLPQQALVDGDGRLRCFIRGAVEDEDYAEIAALVR